MKIFYNIAFSQGYGYYLTPASTGELGIFCIERQPEWVVKDTNLLPTNPEQIIVKQTRIDMAQDEPINHQWLGLNVREATSTLGSMIAAKIVLCNKRLMKDDIDGEIESMYLLEMDTPQLSRHVRVFNHLIDVRNISWQHVKGVDAPLPA